MNMLMKKINRWFGKSFLRPLGLILMFSALLASCKGAYNDIDDYVTLHIAVDEEKSDFRTAYPQISSLDSFSQFALTCDGLSIGKWKETSMVTAYQTMNNDSIRVSRGSHLFELTGTGSGGTKYTGTQTVDIETSETLSFSLMFAGVAESTSTGTVTFEITYPNVSDVGYLTLYRYDYDSPTSRVHSESAGISANAYSYQSTSVDADTLKWTPASQTPVAGKYLYEVKFYTSYNRQDELGVVKEIAYVAPGLTTNIKMNISSFNDLHTIEYKNTSGSTLSSGSYKLNYTSGSNEIILPEPEKDYFTFTGWYEEVDDEGNGLGERVYSINCEERTENITLYATWESIKYDVNFYTNLVTDSELNELFATEHIAYSDYAYTPDPAPTKDGYTFVGWAKSGYNANTPNLNAIMVDADEVQITAETSLYAVWKYNISFDKNADDADGEMNALEVLTSWLGYDNTKLPANAYTYEGHSFLGWASASTATQAEYVNAAEIGTEITENHTLNAPTTLYAIWYDNSEGYVVSFESNGGSPVESQIVAANGTATEPTVTKDSHTLIGWYTSSDNGETLSATEYDFTAAVTENLTLYAKWNHTSWHVSSEGNNTSGDATSSRPYATVTKALTGIIAEGDGNHDYEIVVHGEVTENAEITDTLTTDIARKLTIRGATGNTSDSLKAAVGSKSTLLIGTLVPVTLRNIKITGGSKNGYGSGVLLYVEDAEPTLTLETGALISGNRGGFETCGTGICVYTGTLIMNEGAVIYSNGTSANTTNDGKRGGGVYVNEGASFTMNGGLIKGNNLTGNADNDGGAGVYVLGTFIMNGGTISNNSTKYHTVGITHGGGGVFVAADGSFTMNNGVIEKNESYGCGGGVHNTGTFLMNNGEIKNNINYQYINGKWTANTPYGGGVYNTGTFTMKNGTISGNSASCGGGIANTGTATIENGTISNNYSPTNPSNSSNYYLPPCGGGGLYNKAGTLTMLAGTVDGNKAYTYGGGVYIYAGSFEMSGGTISNNTNYNDNNSLYGGGVYNTTDGTFTMNGGVLENNIAKSGSGGALYNYGSFKIGGSAHIPYGGSPTLNEVTLYTVKPITLTSALSSNTIVATITFRSEWAIGDVVLTADSEDISIEEASVLFATSKSSQGYYIDTEGKYAQAYGIGYRRSGNYELTSDTTIDPRTVYTFIPSRDTSIPLYAATRPKYDFEGWHKDPNCNDDPITELTAEDFSGSWITLYCKFTEKTKYSLTWKDGEIGSPGSIYMNGFQYHYVGETESLPTHSKSGYIFDGWYALESDGETLSSEALTEINDEVCTGPLTLYARWKPHYIITFKDAGGGDFSGTTSTVTYMNQTGSANLYNATKTDYIFDGWYTSEDDGVTLSEEKITKLTDANCTSDITIYAKWKPHYFITYKDAGGSDYSGTNISSLPSFYNEGESAKTVPNAVKSGYVFVGWYTSEDGGETLSEDAVTAINGDTCTGNMTLYAKWKNHYVVSVREVGDTEILDSPIGFNEGSHVTLPRYYHNGMVFVDWYTNPDGSGDPITELNDSNCTSDMTIYGKWIPEQLRIETNNSGDFRITSSTETDTITYTAPDGFSDYTWTIADLPLSDIPGFTVSSDGKTVTVTRAQLFSDFVYDIKVTAVRDGTVYIRNISVSR